MSLQIKEFQMNIVAGVWTVQMPVGAKALYVKSTEFRVLITALVDITMKPRPYSLYVIGEDVDVPNDARYLGSYQRPDEPTYHVFSKHFDLKYETTNHH